MGTDMTKKKGGELFSIQNPLNRPFQMRGQSDLAKAVPNDRA